MSVEWNRIAYIRNTLYCSALLFSTIILDGGLICGGYGDGDGGGQCVFICGH